MRHLTLRLAVAITTFIIGISVASIGPIKRRLAPQTYSTQLLPLTDSKAFVDLQPSKVDETYAVYSAVLSSDRYNDELVVIRDHTFHRDFADASNLNREMSELTQDTVNDYQANNKEDRPLTDAFSLNSRRVFLSDKEEKWLFRAGHDGWSSFYKKYPHARGIVSLSGVGFNHDQTQALVNIGIGCGWLCGEGNFILLQKRNGSWSVQSSLMTWVS